jgi:hypothetical protein
VVPVLQIFYTTFILYRASLFKPGKTKKTPTPQLTLQMALRLRSLNKELSSVFIVLKIALFPQDVKRKTGLSVSRKIRPLARVGDMACFNAFIYVKILDYMLDGRRAIGH